MLELTSMSRIRKRKMLVFLGLSCTAEDTVILQ